MNRDKNLPLTETVYYILLVLTKPAHGYAIMQKIEELSGGEVRIAAGTLYGAIENLLQLNFIQPVMSNDPRRKVYMITERGYQVLLLDYNRMKKMIAQTENFSRERG